MSDAAAAVQPTNRFRHLAITHALMVAGDAAMVVALANSFFFDVDPNAARSRILSFLVVSFAPFVILAPLIGPMIDRVKGGRQKVIATVAAARIAVQIMMVFWIDSVLLFPLVFAALVLQKTYTVSKQALVPGAVDDQRQLVEANAKLGVIAGLAGGVAVMPASLLQLLFDGRGALLLSAGLFGVALWSTRQLPHAPTNRPGEDRTGAGYSHALPPPEPAELAGKAGAQTAASKEIQVSWAAMFVLRALAGYMLFYLAFWFRGQGNTGTAYVGIALAAGGAATMVGNMISPRLSRLVSNETLMIIALAIPMVAGLTPLLFSGPALAVIVTSSVSLGAAIGRLSFESVVQREVAQFERGRAFARFETRFQLGWVLAALVPVLLRIPPSTGLVLVGITAAVTLVVFGWETIGDRRRAAPARSTDRGRRARSGLAENRGVGRGRPAPAPQPDPPPPG